MPRAAAVGAAGGAGWGVLARIWMRLIATDPEFSWSGTLAIIGFAAVLGCGVGLVAESRREDRSLWWTLAVIPGMVLFLSPGMVLLPSFLVGALAFARRSSIARAVGWVGIAVSVVGFPLLVALDPEPGSDTSPSQLVVFVIGFALMATSLAWAGSHIWRRRAPRPTPITGPDEVRSVSRAPGLLT
jgi:hypothetical protein